MAVKKASLKALEVEEEQEEEEIPTEMPVIESNQCVVDLFTELKPLILRHWLLLVNFVLKPNEVSYNLSKIG